MIGIIGTGICGLAAAFELNRRGLPTTVFGKLEDSASRCAQGNVAIKGLTTPESELFAAKMAGQKALRTLLATLVQHGLSVKILPGLIEPYADQSAAQAIAQRVYRGLDPRQFGTETRQLDSTLWSYREAWFYPDDFWFCARECLHALQQYLQQRGVIFVDDHIHGVSYADDAWVLSSAHGEKTVQDIIVAAGERSPTLLRQLGCEDLPLIPVPGVSVDWMIHTGAKSPQGFVSGTNGGAILADRVRLGSTSLKDPSQSEAEQVTKLQRTFAAYFNPQRAWFNAPIKVDSGVRMRTADRLPVIGARPSRHSGKNIWVITGMHKNGWQVGLLASWQLVDMMLKTSHHTHYPSFEWSHRR